MTLDEAYAKVKETFPGQLRDCMALAGVTPLGLARAIGNCDARVHDWLQGRHLPSAVSLVAIADVLEVSVDLLLTGEER